MNSNQLIALAPIITIAVTAVAVMLGIAVRRNFILSCGIAAVGIVIALSTLGIASRESPVRATLLILVDAYSLFYMALLLSGGLAVLGFCYDYFKEREGENEELPLLLLTALLGGWCWSAAAILRAFL